MFRNGYIFLITLSELVNFVFKICRYFLKRGEMVKFNFGAST